MRSNTIYDCILFIQYSHHSLENCWLVGWELFGCRTNAIQVSLYIQATNHLIQRCIYFYTYMYIEVHNTTQKPSSSFKTIATVSSYHRVLVLFRTNGHVIRTRVYIYIHKYQENAFHNALYNRYIYIQQPSLMLPLLAFRQGRYKGIHVWPSTILLIELAMRN